MIGADGSVGQPVQADEEPLYVNAKQVECPLEVHLGL
jgi:hypothetical protein